MQKYVYFFGGGKAEGKGDMKDTLGGKGAGLAEMTNAGLPVPPGFTISTDVCKVYYDNKGNLDTDIPVASLQELVKEFRALVKEKTKADFPQDPRQQLQGAINAVFGSWKNPRATHYRRMNKISEDLGTAVNVQAMVFGNMGNTSGTGVGFTRNPSTGEKEFYGEFLINAQGEDVVAGIRTPTPIRELDRVMPECYRQLREITDRLERHYRDMQDFEFTIQENRLYMLQTRNGKRTGKAAVKIASDMVGEGLITPEEAIMRVEPSQLEQLLHPVLDPKANVKALAQGLPASPGAVSG